METGCEMVFCLRGLLTESDMQGLKPCDFRRPFQPLPSVDVCDLPIHPSSDHL